MAFVRLMCFFLTEGCHSIFILSQESVYPFVLIVCFITVLICGGRFEETSLSQIPVLLLRRPEINPVSGMAFAAMYYLEREQHWFLGLGTENSYYQY